MHRDRPVDRHLAFARTLAADLWPAHLVITGSGRVIVIIMGVSGAGKTTIGSKLAATLGCAFVEGDALHPDTNVSKMAKGQPLTNADRIPWLAAIRDRMEAFDARRQDAVVACSALKASYRDQLANGLPVA